jgi:hypothetical protein
MLSIRVSRSGARDKEAGERGRVTGGHPTVREGVLERVSHDPALLVLSREPRALRSSWFRKDALLIGDLSLHRSGKGVSIEIVFITRPA